MILHNACALHSGTKHSSTWVSGLFKRASLMIGLSWRESFGEQEILFQSSLKNLRRRNGWIYWKGFKAVSQDLIKILRRNGILREIQIMSGILVQFCEFRNFESRDRSRPELCGVILFCRGHSSGRWKNTNAVLSPLGKALPDTPTCTSGSTVSISGSTISNSGAQGDHFWTFLPPTKSIHFVDYKIGCRSHIIPDSLSFWVPPLISGPLIVFGPKL